MEKNGIGRRIYPVKFQKQDRGSMSQDPQLSLGNKFNNLKYIKRIATIAAVGLFVVTGLLIAVVVALYGAYQSSDMMTKTSESTVAMHTETQEMRTNVESWIHKFRKEFPSNQEVLTTQQILGTIENIHKISARGEYLLSNIEPESLPNVVKNLNGVLEKFQKMTNNVDKSQMDRIMATAFHLSELVAGISPTQINQFMGGISETAEHVGHMADQADADKFIDKATTLIAAFKKTTEKINAIQKVTIDLSDIKK